MWTLSIQRQRAQNSATCSAGLTVDSMLSADSNFGTHDTHDRSTYSTRTSTRQTANGTVSLRSTTTPCPCKCVFLISRLLRFGGHHTQTSNPEPGVCGEQGGCSWATRQVHVRAPFAHDHDDKCANAGCRLVRADREEDERKKLPRNDDPDEHFAKHLPDSRAAGRTARHGVCDAAGRINAQTGLGPDRQQVIGRGPTDNRRVRGRSQETQRKVGWHAAATVAGHVSEVCRTLSPQRLGRRTAWQRRR